MGCTMSTWAGTKLEEQVKVTSVTDEHKRKGAFFFAFFFFLRKNQNTS